MTNTDRLIEELTKQNKPIKLINPRIYVIKLGIIILLYAIFLQNFFGIRADLQEKLKNPLFASEIMLLGAIFISTLIASVIMMFPDNYQTKKLLKLPYILISMMLLNLTLQIFFINNNFKTTSNHDIECSLFLAIASIIPTIIIFINLKRGAILNPNKAGIMAVIATSSISALILRFIEDNDSAIHLISWHYLPIVVFCAFGAIIGRIILKW